MKKRVLVLGGGGFIGGHLAHRLKNDGCHVRICDIKRNDFWLQDEICHEFLLGDLRDPNVVSLVIEEGVDEVYQLAADMGGAGYIFTGENDANVMHSSAVINLNVGKECVTKNVKKVFYSSSACIYPEHNQLDPSNPNCEEKSAYPANPDSEYGWEKLFSERFYMALKRNFGLNIRIARFHNIFGPKGTFYGGKEKAPAAVCRKVAIASEGGEIEVWGDGLQTRSFLYVDECVEAVLRLMHSDFVGPVNIGSEEMVTINKLAELVTEISGKSLRVNNIKGEEFVSKYGFNCPVGVRGRNSDNRLYMDEIGWVVNEPLSTGLAKTYQWVSYMVEENEGLF